MRLELYSYQQNDHLVGKEAETVYFLENLSLL